MEGVVQQRQGGQAGVWHCPFRNLPFNTDLIASGNNDLAIGALVFFVQALRQSQRGEFALRYDGGSFAMGPRSFSRLLC